MKRMLMIAAALVLMLCSCESREKETRQEPLVVRAGTEGADARVNGGSRAPDRVTPLVVPSSVPQATVDAINGAPGVFFAELRAILSEDAEGLLVLVDKSHALPASYEPSDLVPLVTGRSYVAGRSGLSLRAGAEAALESMAAAARADGVTLIVSSSYRSFEYQAGLYERNVRELGQAAADRESARPGTSQHQLGTAMDLGSITDAFANTAAGKWMAARGGEWGWSLSYPQGHESATGYRWESWHWRYVGKSAAAFQEKWFAGVQQYMLETIDAWERYSAP